VVAARDLPLETSPPPALASESAASASPAPDPLPPKPAEALAAQEPQLDVSCLPYPFCVMKPSEVPEEIWQRARAANRKT
jgi:hypothetical protein